MLTPAPTRFHRWLLPLYFERRARRRFARVAGRGLRRLEPWNRGGAAREPLIIVANHSAWWDALLPAIISCRLGRHDAYGLMDHEQLGRHRFFRRVGLFSVDRANARAAMRSIAFAADLLRDSSRVLWIFPQGAIVPNDLRPLRCESGTAHLARMVGRCAILPVAIRYELARDEYPSAFISAGEPIHLDGSPIDPRSLTATIAAMLERELDSVRDAMLAERTDDFTTIVRGRKSINEIVAGR